MIHIFTCIIIFSEIKSHIDLAAETRISETENERINEKIKNNQIELIEIIELVSKKMCRTTGQ